MERITEITAKYGVMPVINIPSAELATKVANALREGGLPLIEVTLRSPDSLESIAAIRRAYPDMLISAGTVLTPETVDKAIEAGAELVVSPGYDPELVDYCISKGITIIPGCQTASELQDAVKKGLKTVKFFPAELSGGVAAIKLLSGPFPSLRFLPTGGITLDNLGKYLACNKVIACGGSYMATSEQIKSGDFDGIVESCKKAVAIANAARNPEAKPEPRVAVAPEPTKMSGTVVGFGDYMLRLNPEGYLKFNQADKFVINYTGAEGNVLTSLAYMGLPTQFVTKLPDNAIAECAMNGLRKWSVGVDHIALGGERIGVFYCEKGASQRPSKIVYDRKYSSFSTSSPEDYDWNKIFDGAAWFHFTGITPALGGRLPEICLEACKEAKKRGITVSCDLNYRKNLWTRAQAKQTMESLLAYVDLLIANEEDAADVLDIHAAGSDVNSGKLDRDGYIEVADKIRKKYGIGRVAITLRKSISASDNDWSALLYDGEAHFSREYHIHIVDRVGGGDSFGAGLIYAVMNGFDSQGAIEYAAAASCLKQTIELDVNLSKPSDILALAGGNGSGRVQR